MEEDLDKLFKEIISNFLILGCGNLDSMINIEGVENYERNGAKSGLKRREHKAPRC